MRKSIATRAAQALSHKLAPQRSRTKSTLQRAVSGCIEVLERRQLFSAPTAPPLCTPINVHLTNETDTPIPDLDPITSTINVSGVPTYLWDLDLETFITHNFSADLDITLTSPEGTTVTITTDNGSDLDNVFNGTLWDDQGGTPVTDAIFASGVTETPLVPEGAFGAFIGEDPNGDWTLTIRDDVSTLVGTLNEWSLDLTTFADVPTETFNPTFTNPTDTPVLSLDTVTSTILVSGLSDVITDLNLTTVISHASSQDLNVTLTSPAGTVVTITTANGGSGSASANIFNGTLWNDDAGGPTTDPVTDAVLVGGVAETPLVPEEAMAAFNGQDPNGTWTLTITDTFSLFAGVLNEWSLGITTGTCNEPPTANDDSASTAPSTSVSIDVLANDSDPNGSPLALSVVVPPTDGTAVVNNNGTPGDLTDDFIDYTPNTLFHGTDAFLYQVDDGFGGTDTAVITVTVGNGAGVGPDPTGMDDALDVAGTGGHDIITITGVKKKPGDVIVVINGVKLNGGAAFTGIEVIYAFGLAGNDTITVSNLKLPTMLFGDANNDKLTGGDASNVLVGGTGHDVLLGNSDVDLLIGGLGGDTAKGQDGNDILVAGTTIFDTNILALADIRDGTIPLLLSQTADDFTIDVLDGGGGSDTFYANTIAPGVLDTIVKPKNDALIELV